MNRKELNTEIKFLAEISLLIDVEVMKLREKQKKFDSALLYLIEKRIELKK